MPTELISLRRKKITTVVAGGNSSYALSACGLIYAWGNNLSGQLGLGHIANVFVPTLVEPLQDHNVVQIAAGNTHLIALTDKGLVYTAGYSIFGQLGHGDKEQQRYPKTVAFFDGKKVKKISAGAGVCYALL